MERSWKKRATWGVGEEEEEEEEGGKGRQRTADNEVLRKFGHFMVNWSNSESTETSGQQRRRRRSRRSRRRRRRRRRRLNGNTGLTIKRKEEEPGD